MPVLKNQRHEIFAQELAKGKTATEAYETAGFSPNRANAARLKSYESVGARVAEIQGAGAARAEISLAGVLSELDQAIAIARAKGQPNALVNAAALRAKLGGLMVEKQQVEVVSPKREPENAAEVLAEICREVSVKAAKALAEAFEIPWNEGEVLALANGSDVSQPGRYSQHAIEEAKPNGRKRPI